MPKFSIAGSKPVNIIIEADVSEKKAIEMAREGEGWIEECIGADTEIEDNPSVVNLDEEEG